MTILQMKLSKHNGSVLITGDQDTLHKLHSALYASTLNSDCPPDIARQLCYTLRQSYTRGTIEKTISTKMWVPSNNNINPENTPTEQQEVRLFTATIYIPVLVIQLTTAGYFLQKLKQHAITDINIINTAKMLLIQAIGAKDAAIAGEITHWMIKEPKFSKHYDPLYLVELSEKYLSTPLPCERLKQLPNIMLASSERGKEYRAFQNTKTKQMTNPSLRTFNAIDIFQNIRTSIQNGLIQI